MPYLLTLNHLGMYVFSVLLDQSRLKPDFESLLQMI